MAKRRPTKSAAIAGETIGERVERSRRTMPNAERHRTKAATAAAALFSQVASRDGASRRQAADVLIAVAVVLAWAVSGPLFGFSDTWQLVINTSTTIVTFLMVFLIQHTQNRDTLALQLKLAELIIAMQGAKNKIATAEDLSEEDLERLHERISHGARSRRSTHLERRRDDPQAQARQS